MLIAAVPRVLAWIVVFSTAVCCSTNLCSQEWSRFRGANASGVSGDSELGGGEITTTWSDTENLAWKTRLPGKGSSSPVAFDDLVFLTAYSGYGRSLAEPGNRSELRLHVICLSIEDGHIIWDQQIDPAPEEQDVNQRVADHGYASPTPCVDEKHVYASFGPSGVVALTHHGDLAWRRSVGTSTVFRPMRSDR